MESCCQRVCRLLCCRRSSKRADLEEINISSRLLSQDRNEIKIFGLADQSLTRENIDLSKITKSPVRKIVCGEMHCIILFEDGQLGGFGCNKAGQLGFQINNQRINEVCINKKFLNDNYEILDIGAGNNFSLILVRQGSENKLLKFGIKQEDRLVDESFDTLKIINIVDIEYQRIKKIESIFVFDERSLFLTQDKKLYTLTNNSFKEYVDLSRIMIRSINIGLQHCLILDENGRAWAIGSNDNGQLGFGVTSNVENLTMLEGFDSGIKKIAVGAEHSLVLLITEELYAFGNNIMGQCTGPDSLCLEPIKVEIPNNGNVNDIYSGYYHNLIVLSTGEMLTWGDCSNGKLGYKEDRTKVIPKSIDYLRGKYPNCIGLGSNLTVISTTSNFENSISNKY